MHKKVAVALRGAEDVLRTDVFEFVTDQEAAKQYQVGRPHCVEITVQKISQDVILPNLRNKSQVHCYYIPDHFIITAVFT